MELPHLRSAKVWLPACLLLPLIAHAQQPSGEAPVFSEVVEVRVVNLEVVVTDRQGRRVPGLVPADFELRIDGEVVPIEYFTEIREAAAIGHAEGPREAGTEVAEIPSLIGGQRLRTNYLVFIDEYFSLGRDRDRMLDRLREQIDLLGPEDRMALVRYDGHDLERLTTWTGDRAELREAIGNAKNHPSRGLQRLAEARRDRFLLSTTDLNRSLIGLDTQLSVDERYFVGRVTEQVERVVTAAVSTLRGFAAPPGRKVMVLMAGGWPYDPAEYVIDDPRRLISDSSVRRGAQLLSPLTDTANLLGYTLYPIDVPGFQASAIDAERAVTGGLASSLSTRSYVRETGIHDTLHHLARETGGLPLINVRRDELLSGVVGDTRSFYWLGFTPERRRDDERHRVEIRVLRPGLKVRGRRGYYDFSREREVTLAVESALYFGSPPSAEPLLVRLGRGRRSGLKTMKVPLSVGIPADAITLLPGPQGWSARLELRVAVLDKNGATADTPVIPLAFSVEERPRPGAILRYETELKMRRKEHDLVVAVYDIPTGTILSSSLEVAP